MTYFNIFILKWESPNESIETLYLLAIACYSRKALF